jgi:chromate transporter
MEKLWQIFFSFLKVGTIGFGGGQATIPLIEAEVVDNYGWLTADEFSDFYAIGNTLPGPIATKMSIVIGFDQAGFLGAILALLGLLLPSSIAIIIIYLAFMEFKDTKFVQGMQKAAKPAVAVLIGGVAYGMVRKLVASFSTESTTNTIILIGLFVVSLTMFLLNEYEILKVHPAFVVIGALLVGGFFIR